MDEKIYRELRARSLPLGGDSLHHFLLSPYNRDWKIYCEISHIILVFLKQVLRESESYCFIYLSELFINFKKKKKNASH